MQTRTSVPAAERMLALLRHMSQQAGPVGAAALARDLELPRSTVYHLLTVAERAGFVVHLPEERRYGLGLAAFELGTAFSRQEPLARLARPLLARLVDRVGESAHLAVLHGREVLYVVEDRAPGRPPLVTDVGVRLPAHLTASGRAMLAALPAPAVLALFPDPAAFVDRTGRGPRSLVELRRVLVRVRARGYAVEDGEVTAGTASVAAAVLDHTGHPVAGVAVTYPTRSPHDTGADQRSGDLVAAVRATAAEIAKRLHGRP